ncbi:MAG: HD domain-containing protein [Magnetococcus sp. DMHC-1]|nr:HD domain-containing protein [Magnetococcales bacterium]
MNIQFFDILDTVGNTLDLVDPHLSDHHRKVAHIAERIASAMNFSPQETNNLVYAGLLHDCGALTLREKTFIAQLDMDSRDSNHAETGYNMLREFRLFANLATLVRHHHIAWNHGSGAETHGEPTPMGCHILHVADRVAVQIDNKVPALAQTNTIREKIRQRAGRILHPDVVAAFEEICAPPAFWFDLFNQNLSEILKSNTNAGTLRISLTELEELSRFIATIIDFRCRFTATHSQGVAITAEHIARRVGMSHREQTMMRIAGFLHDLGKLAVPTEILYKTGPLTPEEMGIMQIHTYVTYHSLRPIKELATINEWASFHHETIDGKGYPFRIPGRNLVLGARIMSIADIFTALTEDRPYRPGMSQSQVQEILASLVAKEKIDPMVCAVVTNNFAEIDYHRRQAQNLAQEKYRGFAKESNLTE